MKKLNLITIPDCLSYSRNIKYVDVKHSCDDLVDAENYDVKTLVYDVFLTTCNSYLVIISPPWLNLSDLFLPLKIQFLEDHISVGEKSEFLYCHDRTTVIKIPINKQNLDTENPIKIDFNGVFNWEGIVDINIYSNIGRVLVTMQQDNKLAWIKSFVDYYKENFSISHVIVYDNNSSAYEGGTKMIENLDSSVSVVEWDFPYGSSKNDWDVTAALNHFSQVGCLNHARLKYGSDQLMFNFDIDELLHVNSKENVENTKTITSFKQIFVPNIIPESKDYLDLSYKDYLYQEIEERYPSNYYASKYVFIPEQVEYCDVHFANEINEPLLYRLSRYKLFRESIRLFVGKKFLTKISKSREGLRCCIKDCYYLHYIGINTGWMYPDRTTKIEFDKLKHKRIDLWSNR